MTRISECMGECYNTYGTKDKKAYIVIFRHLKIEIFCTVFQYIFNPSRIIHSSKASIYMSTTDATATLLFRIIITSRHQIEWKSFFQPCSILSK